MNTNNQPYPEDFTAQLRLPPHSKEAERGVIGGLLVNPYSYDDVSDIVSAGDFYLGTYRLIFEGISVLSEAGKPVDVITLSEYLNASDELDSVGGLGELAEIQTDTPSAANVRSYARIVHEKAMERGLLATADEIVQIVYGEGAADEKVNSAQGLVLGVNSDTQSGGIEDVNQVLKRTIDQIEDRFNNKDKPQGITTGLTSLDERLCGLRPSDLVLLAGRPSMGKTTLAMQIAMYNAIEMDKSVLVFSLEMSSDQLIERAIASTGSVPFNRIRNGDLVQTDWPGISAGVQKIKDSKMHIDDTGGLHINQIRTRARKHKRANGLDLVVIDYIQLIRSDGQSREREVGNISVSLKALAKELEVPVIALSQLSRSVENRAGSKRPINSDLRDSGSLEQDADIILFTYRDEVYDEDSPAKGVAEIICRKFRNGELGTTYLRSRLEYCRFETMDGGYSPPEETQKPKSGMNY